MDLISIVSVTVLCLLIFAICKSELWKNPQLSSVPGLKPSNIREGNLPDIRKAGSMKNFLHDLHTAYGDIAKFWWEDKVVVSIASPDLFKEHSKVFNRPLFVFKWFEKLIGKSSFTLTNGLPGQCRRSAHEPFLSYMTTMSHVPTFVEVVKEAISSWSQEDMLKVSVGKFTSKMALKASTLCLFCDEDYYSQNMKEDEFIDNYRKIWSNMRQNMMRSDEEPTASYLDALNHVKCSVSDLIEYRRKTRLVPNETEKFVDHLIEKYDDEVVLADAITILDGALEPTSSFMTFCIYYLALYEDIQDRLYQEIDNILGDEEVTAESLSHFRYLQQVLNETMRCTAIAPWEVKYADDDTTLGGHIIPGGTPVVHAIGEVHQNDTFWLNPERFDPDRFGNGRKLPNHYTFVPFGFAPKRKCIGNRFGTMQTSVYLIVLLQKFKMRLLNVKGLPYSHGLAVHICEDVFIALEERTSTSSHVS